MTAAREAAHVVAHDSRESYRMECLHCGKTYTAALFCPLNLWLALAEQFQRDHRRCPAPAAEARRGGQ